MGEGVGLPMWIGHLEGWLSIVKHRVEDGMLLVRARESSHIGDLWPHAHVEYTPEADYQYRAVISADEVADVVAEQVVNIGYDNFKKNVTEPRLSRAFSQIWVTMLRWFN